MRRENISQKHYNYFEEHFEEEMEKILDAEMRNETHCISQNGCFTTGDRDSGFSGCLYPEEISSTWCEKFESTCFVSESIENDWVESSIEKLFEIPDSSDFEPLGLFESFENTEKDWEQDSDRLFQNQLEALLAEF